MTEAEKSKIKQLSLEGVGYRKIADILGLPANSVKTHLRRHPVVTKTTTTAFCENCGKPVPQTPNRKQKRFCSDKCRIAWWNVHPDLGQNRNLRSYTCSFCGRTFKSYSKRRQYCSRGCYAAARRKKVGVDE